MAKNTIYINIDVDDKGTTKRVAIDANKLSKALNDTSASAAQADRNIKGTAQASSNATKNFSKMSQGMGGLVAAYATVAAQVFALSAAYQFLLEASDFTLLVKGQQALSATTGVSYSSITKSIQQATNAQLSYKQAAQAAAISTASGLTGDQITRIAKLSDTISKTLGRDLEDTFNRLTRGITKAEPELLDELGIVLRLKDAQREYALSVGKSADALTAYERTQAVFLFTVTQGEDKFGALTEMMDGSSNKVRQLGAALSQIADKLKPIISSISEVVAGALTENLTATIATFGFLVSGVFRQLLPSIQDLEAGYKESIGAINDRLTEHSKKLEEARIKLLSYKKAQQVEKGGGQKAISSILSEVEATKQAQGITRPFSSSIEQLGQGTLKTNAIAFSRLRLAVERELASLERTNKITVSNMRSQFVGMTKDQLIAMKVAMAVMRGEITATRFAQNGLTASVNRTTLALGGLALQAQVAATTLAGYLALAGARLLSFLGTIGVVITTIAILVNTVKTAREYLQGLQNQRGMALSESLKTVSEEIKNLIKDLESMKTKAGSAFGSARAQIAFFGNAAANIPVSTIINDFSRLEGLVSVFDILTGQIETSNKSLSDLNNESRKLGVEQVSLQSDINKSRVTGEQAREASARIHSIILERKIIAKNFKAIEGIIDKQTTSLTKLQNATADSMLANFSSLSAYVALNPELKKYEQNLYDASLTLDELIQGQEQTSFFGNADPALSAEEFQESLKALRATTREATAEALAHAEALTTSQGELKSYEQQIKSFDEKLKGSIQLTEIEQNILDLTNILSSYNNIIASLEKTSKQFSTKQLADFKKEADGYKEILDLSKQYLQTQRDIARESAENERLKAQLSLIEGTTSALIALRGAQRIAEVDIQVKELDLQKKELDLKAKALQKESGKSISDIQAALNDSAGNAIATAGSIHAKSIENAINAGATKHATLILEAFAATAEKTLPQYLDQNSPAAALVDRFQQEAEAARVMAEATNTEAAERVAQRNSAGQSRTVGLDLQVQNLDTTTLTKMFEEAINAQSATIDIKIDTTKIQKTKEFINSLKEQLNLEKSIIAEREKNTSVISEIVSQMASGVSKSEAQVALAEQEVAFRSLELRRFNEIKQLEKERLNLNEQGAAIFDELTRRERESLDLAIKNAEVKKQNLEREVEAARIAQKYNDILAERSIQEQYLALAKGSYAESARESFAVESQSVKVAQSREQIVSLEQQAFDLQQKIASATEDELLTLVAQRDRLRDTYKAQYQALLLEETKLDVYKQQVGEIYKIGEAARSALGEGLTEEFAKILKGGAVDLEQSALALIQTVGNAVADQMAKMLSDATLDLFGMGPESEEAKARQRAIDQAAILDTKLRETFGDSGDTLSTKIKQAMGTNISALETSFQQSTQNLVTALNTAFTEGAAKIANAAPATAAAPGTPSTPATPASNGATAASAGAVTAPQSACCSIDIDTFNTAFDTQTTSFMDKLSIEFDQGAIKIAEAIKNSRPSAEPTQPGAVTSPSIDNAVKRVANASEQTSAETRTFGETVQKGLEGAGQDLSNFGKSISTGFDKSFGSGIKAIFTADAPWIRSMVGGITGALGTVLAGAFGGGGGGSSKSVWRNAIIGGVVSGLSMGFMSWLSTPGTPPAGNGTAKANGGVFEGGFKAFANGGIVNKPTLGLVGEGKYNEAVVPLPDGQSIPVIMKQEIPKTMNFKPSALENINSSVVYETEFTPPEIEELESIVKYKTEFTAPEVTPLETLVVYDIEFTPPEVPELYSCVNYDTEFVPPNVKEIFSEVNYATNFVEPKVRDLTSNVNYNTNFEEPKLKTLTEKVQYTTSFTEPVIQSLEGLVNYKTKFEEPKIDKLYGIVDYATTFAEPKIEPLNGVINYKNNYTAPELAPLSGVIQYTPEIMPTPVIPRTIVPEAPQTLPNMMQNGNVATNNVGINVTVNNNGSTQAQAQPEMSNERAIALAQAMQNVVTQELKRQKRPGGLLSPYA